MNINIGSIMSKVEAWSKTEEGKRRINEVIERYRKEGRKATVAGSRVLTNDAMYEAAEKFISILRSTAQSMDLPDSVLLHFDSLKCTQPFELPDRSTEMYIYFDDALYNGLHRDSLQPEKYDGVDDIIAVLNNGYSKHESMSKVWGVWHGVRVHGLTERTGLRFIQKAIAEFNEKYGAMYNVTAKAEGDYE